MRITVRVQLCWKPRCGFDMYKNRQPSIKIPCPGEHAAAGRRCRKHPESNSSHLSPLSGAGTKTNPPKIPGGQERQCRQLQHSRMQARLRLSATKSFDRQSASMAMQPLRARMLAVKVLCQEKKRWLSLHVLWKHNRHALYTTSCT
jgi:hypothetical protein